jgi:HlyD family secretion protein
MNKKIVYILTLVIIIATIVMSIIVLKGGDSKKIDFVYPTYSDIAHTITFNGNIYPNEEIDIKSSVSGIVDSIYVNVGDIVVVGQPLARVKVVPDPIEIDVAQSSLRLANIALEREEKNYERASKLYKSKVIAKAEFEDDQKSYDMTVEQQRSAQTKLNRLLNIHSVENNNFQNIVTSTTEGTIIDIPIEKGGSVVNRSSYGSGTSIATIANINFKKDMVFKAKVAERDMYFIKENQPISIIIKAAVGDTIKTFISKIYPKGYFDQGITKYSIEASINLEKMGTQIYYGYSATAEVVLEKHSHVMTIEQKFLQFHQDTTLVEVLNAKNEIENRIVKTGITDGLSVEILRGLTLKDRLVIPQQN